MLTKLLKGYPLITKFNWGIAAILIGLNVYLYPRLPQVVPIHFNLFNQPSNFGGKMIIWIFPLIFVAFSVFFNESKLDAVFSRSVKRNQLTKMAFMIFQLVLWVLILRAYSAYFLFI
ncbi:DUF1648 domain-containing protein [Enterococcus sp. 5H]|uniref:DUF1648 domain-containing protein n=1 Tax=Enterococcus sp. 5H TaxID=1229490 RepID=UPI0023037FD1|nr:DUF1648 domain-containing protein [Enterococcus sp. 5H]MDA9472197.1 hypothetical protein [Enterococcus sp. 5H]